ncbi:MAG: hypothetical protein V7K50_25845 [Nostoc sp.]|uniref:hypothetical protein n=1 Tax=Nostoc sp. TaxID=1180 RepID=UPI002FFA0247
MLFTGLNARWHPSSVYRGLLATHYPLFFPSQSFWGWLSICASGYSTCGISILFHAPYQKLILNAVKTVVSELAELHELLISQG